MNRVQSCEMEAGRTFVLSIEAGERLKQSIEEFCVQNHILYGTIAMVGTVDKGTRIVTALRERPDRHMDPLHYEMITPAEAVGNGTIFPEGELGLPAVHIHGSVGVNGTGVTGCFREDVVVWLSMEVVIHELIGRGPVRAINADTGIRTLAIEK